jgi:D-xylose transport system substrate-binding protein
MFQKKILPCFFIAVTAAALFLLNLSCGKVPENRIKIGFLLKTMQEERYKKDKAAFERKAGELGVDVVFDSANNDAQIQLAKFQNMLVKGCKVIVLQPVNTGTAGNLVKMAHNEGVKVVGYDSMIINGPLDFMVMQDSWAVGRLQGEAMLKWFREKRGKIEGNVVLIKGQPGDSNTNAISSGVLEIIKNNPGLTLVAQQYHAGWSPEKSNVTAQNMLTKYNNKIDAFVCNNSGMCRGLIRALNSVGLDNTDKVFTAGSDADLVNIQFVAQGKQTVDVWKKIDPLAYNAVEVAFLLAVNPGKNPVDLIKADRYINNGFADIPTIITEVVLVDKFNIDFTIIAGGFYTGEQVYGKD